MYLYYGWCKYYCREPSDDEDFVDGLMYMRITGDIQEENIKRERAKSEQRRGRTNGYRH